MPHLHRLIHTIDACRACTLGHTRLHSVPGDGPPTARIMFIGEAPGKHEDNNGKPFVGRAGKLLDTLLADMGLTRNLVYITNLVKCRPPHNRPPRPDELHACRNHLDAEIAAINPQLICTLGRFAAEAVLGPGAPITQRHGHPVTLSHYTVIPLLHPAAGLRSTRMKEMLEQDCQRLRTWLTTHQESKP